MKKFIVYIFILSILITPVLVGAADLVPCGIKDPEVLKLHPEYAKDCQFGHLLLLINNVVNFILFRLAVPIAAIAFCYAGLQLLTSGGSEEKMSQAKKVFGNVAIGLFFVAGAWLIVHTILTLLGHDGSWIGF